jgi:glyoxylase-like metal-dependent hydrolase (beta-lactamase superfamily II)
MTDRLYFRQLLSGRDFATGDMFAAQMRNFAYLIGDREIGDTVVVDPAYARICRHARGRRHAPVGLLVTHHHPTTSAGR